MVDVAGGQSLEAFGKGRGPTASVGLDPADDDAFALHTPAVAVRRIDEMR